jgi:hypothetical protein
MQSFGIRGTRPASPTLRYSQYFTPMPITAQTRYKGGRKSRVQVAEDRLLNMAQLGHRWSRTPVAARLRLEQHGVPLVRFSKSSCEVWLSDVLKLEAQFSSVPSEVNRLTTG